MTNVENNDVVSMPKRKESEEHRKAQQRLYQKRRYQQIKNDPELLALEQEKRRQKYKKKKEERKVKSIAELTPRGQRELRKKWKENSKRYRLRKKGKLEKEPTFDAVIVEAKEEPVESTVSPVKQMDPLRKSIRKIRYNEYKKRKILNSIINKYKKQIDRQRKTIERLVKKLKNQPNQIMTDTQEDQTRKINLSNSMLTGQKWYVEKVQQFYTDDANSTVCAGKKEFVTKNKIKMQKRYLNAPLKYLYHKFLSEVKARISYSHFCKLRPFWTVFPKPSNRDTCLCSQHTNMELLIKALHKASIINVKSSQELVLKLCCDLKNGACLNRTCNVCSTKRLEYKNVSDNNIIFYEWHKTIREITLKNGTKKQQQVTEKTKKIISISAAIKKLENDLIPFFNHVYKIAMQYKALKALKANLIFQEACIHVDFSENYSLKFAAEVQSFHFGGSRQQISLHTSVTYTHNFSSGSVTPISICTISDCLRHDAPAIWAHLVPLVHHILTANPFIDTLHFLSDSPSSQYRNKYMFFIVSQIRKDFPQIAKITWNYCEAGHGKGAPDGVGAVVKRTADRMVTFGSDIGTYDQFYDMLLRTLENVTIIKVEESDIIAKDSLIPRNLKPFKGTLSVHQVIWDVNVPYTILRKISCFDCNIDEKCIHGYDIGRIPNNNYEYTENINPNPIVQLANTYKKENRNPNLRKINILSDITIKQADTFNTDSCLDPKPSTSKM